MNRHQTQGDLGDQETSQRPDRGAGPHHRRGRLRQLVQRAAAARAPAPGRRSPLVGAGSTLVAPLMSKWQSDYSRKTEEHGHLRRDRQRRRDRADHLAHGRLRRLRRAADRRTVRRSQRASRADPVGAERHRPRLQRQRRAEEPETERRSPGRHLPRQDHQLERPGDRQAQPRRQPAEHQDHPGLPQRRQRRHLRLHQLPLDDRPRIRSRRSAPRPRSSSRPASAPKRTTASRPRSRRPTARSATSASPTRSPTN